MTALIVLARVPFGPKRLQCTLDVELTTERRQTSDRGSGAAASSSAAATSRRKSPAAAPVVRPRGCTGHNYRISFQDSKDSDVGSDSTPPPSVLLQHSSAGPCEWKPKAFQHLQTRVGKAVAWLPPRLLTLSPQAVLCCSQPIARPVPSTCESAGACARCLGSGSCAGLHGLCGRCTKAPRHWHDGQCKQHHHDSPTTTALARVSGVTGSCGGVCQARAPGTAQQQAKEAACASSQQQQQLM